MRARQGGVYKEIGRRMIHESVPIIYWCPRCREEAWSHSGIYCPDCGTRLEVRAALLIKD